MKEIILALEFYLIVIVIAMLVAFIIKGMLVLVRLFTPKQVAGARDAGNKGK